MPLLCSNPTSTIFLALPATLHWSAVVVVTTPPPLCACRELYEVAIAVHVRSGHGTTALHLHRLMDAAHPSLPAARPATHGTLPACEDAAPPAPQGGLQRASHGAACAAHGDATPPAQGSSVEAGKALEEASRLEGAGHGQRRGNTWSGVAGRVADGQSGCLQPSSSSSSSSSEGNMSSSEEASSELTFLEAIDAALTHALAQVCPHPRTPWLRCALTHARPGSGVPSPTHALAQCPVAAPVCSDAACTAKCVVPGCPPHRTLHAPPLLRRHPPPAAALAARATAWAEVWGGAWHIEGTAVVAAGGSSRWEEAVAEKVANKADSGGISGLVADLAASGIRVKPRAVQSAIRQLLLHDDCHTALAAAAAPPARPTHPAAPAATAIAIRRPATSSEAAGRVGEVERAEANEEEAGSGGGGSDAEAVPWLERAISLVDALPRLVGHGMAVMPWPDGMTFAQQPTAYVYAELLRACVRKRQWRWGEQLWQQMGAAGVQADVPCWQARLRCLGALNRVAGTSHALLAEAAAAGTAMERHPDLLRDPPLSCSPQQCTAEGVPAGQ
ncbi:unnamed protein product [Closterium sp. Naga37s-1]|nr:unnamed protein product [Closterium sp. Naga37s-1]